MDIQAKRVAYAMWEERRAHTGRDHCGLLCPCPKDAKFLETTYKGMVTKELHCVPVQTRFERLERFLGDLEIKFLWRLHGQRITFCISRTSS